MLVYCRIEYIPVAAYSYVFPVLNEFWPFFFQEFKAELDKFISWHIFCLDVKVFDTDWNRIPSSDFVNIQPGDTVRFTVGGSTTGGSITKARFTINGQLRAEVVGKRPGADEYYDEYTIPQSATGFTVEAQVFHSTLGWF